MKEMREVANLGTPWSGQEVKWNWVTGSRCSVGYNTTGWKQGAKW